MVENNSAIDSGLLEHARMGLKRIHSISQPHEVNVNAFQPSESKDEEVCKKQSKKEDKPNPPSKQPEKKKEYISTKKPVEKSIFYQHSKQGMKYWFEEKKPKAYSSKVPMGRKGTLLGLVDAPLK